MKYYQPLPYRLTGTTPATIIHDEVKVKKEYTVLEALNGFLVMPYAYDGMPGRRFSDSVYIAVDIEEVGRILKKLQNDKPVTA